MIAQPERDRKPASRRNGFTLVEVIVALGLFALIALAGFALLRTVLDSQDRTEGRLRRLSEIQRALFVVGSDLDQVSGRIEGTADRVVFQKTGDGGQPLIVAYARTGDVVTRTVSGPLGERTQPLLSGVASARWAYSTTGLGWLPATPSIVEPPQTVGAPEAALPPPSIRAVAVDLDLIGPDGRPATLRRVIATAEIAP